MVSAFDADLSELLQVFLVYGTLLIGKANEFLTGPGVAGYIP